MDRGSGGISSTGLYFAREGRTEPNAAGLHQGRLVPCLDRVAWQKADWVAKGRGRVPPVVGHLQPAASSRPHDSGSGRATCAAQWRSGGEPVLPSCGDDPTPVFPGEPRAGASDNRDALDWPWQKTQATSHQRVAIKTPSATRNIVDVESTAGTAAPLSAKRLVLVVGYDGSAPARRALDKAVELLDNREGSLEVVYVSQPPESRSLSPETLADVREILDERAQDLADRVRERLRSQDQPWHFSCREGRVTAALAAVAAELQRHYGASADIVIVVGRTRRRYPDLHGSAGSSPVRSDRLPVVVVP
jgi:nucleotide-binding universal stress UspA family protein